MIIRYVGFGRIRVIRQRPGCIEVEQSSLAGRRSMLPGQCKLLPRVRHISKSMVRNNSIDWIGICARSSGRSLGSPDILVSCQLIDCESNIWCVVCIWGGGTCVQFNTLHSFLPLRSLSLVAPDLLLVKSHNQRCRRRVCSFIDAN